MPTARGRATSKNYAFSHRSDGDKTALTAAVEQSIARITEATGDGPDTLIADARYTYIGSVVRRAVSRPAQDFLTTSDKLDRVLAQKHEGIRWSSDYSAR